MKTCNLTIRKLSWLLSLVGVVATVLTTGNSTLAQQSAREQLRERYSPRSYPFNAPSIRGNGVSPNSNNSVLTPRRSPLPNSATDAILTPKPQNRMIIPGPRSTPESTLIIPHSGLISPTNPTGVPVSPNP